MTTSTMRRWRWFVSALMFLFGLLGLLAGPVSAHADVVGAEPADGSVLESRAYPLRLDFNEEFDMSLTTIEVARIPNGVKYEGAVVDQTKSSGKTLYGTIPALPAGDYVLTWKSSGEDGHLTSGQLLYSVRGAATSSAVVPGAATGSADSAADSVATPAGNSPESLALSSDSSQEAPVSPATPTPVTSIENAASGDASSVSGSSVSGSSGSATSASAEASAVAPTPSAVVLAQPMVTAKPEVVVPTTVRDVLRMFGRTAWYMSAALLAGTLLALTWLSRRAVLDLGSEDRVLRFLRRTLAAGWLALFVSALLRVLLAVPVVPGKNQLAAAGTTAGRSAWAILVLTMVFAAVPLRRVLFDNDYSRQVLMLMAGLVLTVGVVDLSGWGHAKALGSLWIAVMTVHLAFVAAWVGIISLLAIWVLLTRSEKTFGTTVAHSALKSFGEIANFVVAAVVITGAGAAWQISGRSTANLVGSEFGRFLLVKLGLLVLFVAPVALHNRKSSTGQDLSRVRARILRALPVEAASLVAVVIVAAMLVGTNPTVTKQVSRQPVATPNSAGFGS